MIRGELEIDAPRSLVWSFLTDPRRTPEYAPSIAHVEIMSGSPGEVGRYTMRMHLRTAGPPRLASTEVRESVVDERYVFSGAAGLLAYDGRYELRRAASASEAFREEPGERTLLRYEVAYRMNGAGAWVLTTALLGLPLLGKVQAERAFPETLAALAKAAERLATS